MGMLDVSVLGYESVILKASGAGMVFFADKGMCEVCSVKCEVNVSCLYLCFRKVSPPFFFSSFLFIFPSFFFRLLFSIVSSFCTIPFILFQICAVMGLSARSINRSHIRYLSNIPFSSYFSYIKLLWEFFGGCSSSPSLYIVSED